MVVKEDVFYYPLHSNLRLNYDLNINNTKCNAIQSNDSECYISEERSKINISKFNTPIVGKEKIINKGFFNTNFGYQKLIDMLKEVYKTKNTNENKKLLNVIKSGLVDLNSEIKKMSENKKERPNELVNVVEKILDSNNIYQEGQELKILLTSN